MSIGKSDLEETKHIAAAPECRIPRGESTTLTKLCIELPSKRAWLFDSGKVMDARSVFIVDFEDRKVGRRVGGRRTW
jgi:hypothetical protein